MKKIILSIPFLLFAFALKAQVYQKNYQYGFEFQRLKVPLALTLPAWAGQLPVNMDSLGLIFYNPADSNLLFHNGKKLIELSKVTDTLALHAQIYARWDSTTIKAIGYLLPKDTTAHWAPAGAYIHPGDTATMLSGYTRKGDTSHTANYWLTRALYNTANGVAPLDAGGKVPFANLPAALMIYKGTWNPTTNAPHLTDSSGTSGWVYIATFTSPPDSVVINLGSGAQTFNSGDYVIYNGTSWQKSVGTNNVKSVNGKQGIVGLTTTDIPEGTNLYFTNPRAQSAISLTTTGTSGAATYAGGVINIPQYQAAGAYLTGNQTITLSGDVTGSGATAITTALKNTGTAGTYTRITTDPQGRVSSGTDTAYQVAGSYALTNGSNATGSWPISITGNAASLSSILSSTLGGSGVNNAGTLTWGAGGTLGSNAYTSTAYLPLTGGTLTGGLTGTTANFSTSITDGGLISAPFVATNSSGTFIPAAYTPYNPASYPVNAGGETLQSVTTRGATTNLGITALKFITSGGTSSQFVKGDGSLQSGTSIMQDFGAIGNLSEKYLQQGVGYWTNASTNTPVAGGFGTLINFIGTGDQYDSIGTWDNQIAASTLGHIYWRQAVNNFPYSSWAEFLTSANYNSYSPTLTGAGASGTWPISITGNSATVTNGFYTTSSFNLGTTSIAVNRASAAQSLTGISIDGNAGTVTNGLYSTGTYADPVWLTSLNYSKLTGTVPTWNQNTTGNAATATNSTQWGSQIDSVVSPSNGQLLSYNGRVWVNHTLVAADIPILNQNTTGSAGSVVNSHSPGFALLGSAFNGSSAQTWNVDSTKVTTTNYVNNRYTGTGSISVNNSTGVISYTGAAGGVTSFSAGTTGLTPSTATTGAITLAGTLAVANGGTGNTSGQAASVANALTLGTDLSGGSYNGSAAVTVNNTSTLATVTGRGATTTTAVTLARTTLTDSLVGISARFTGSVIAAAGYESSDIRLKNLIARKDTINPLLLRMITFHWKPWFSTDTTRTHYGNVAQEVKIIYPDLVNTDGRGYETVNYIELHTLQIYQLKKDNEGLKGEVEQLKETISKQQEEIDDIKKLIKRYPYPDNPVDTQPSTYMMGNGKYVTIKTSLK